MVYHRIPPNLTDYIIFFENIDLCITKLLAMVIAPSRSKEDLRDEGRAEDQ